MKQKRISRLRRMLLLLTAVASTVAARAASAECLTLMVNGAPVTILLADHPVITYKGNTLHITTGANTIDIPVSDISGGTVGAPSAIRTVELDGTQLSNGELRFSQLPAGSTVEVFSMGGAKQMDTAADATGEATVSLDQLPKGTYIVRSAKQTFKFVNK